MSQLTCDICTAPFNCSLHRPVLLPCGDTFCFKCMRDGFDKAGYIKCQNCKGNNFTNPNKLPTNSALMNILIKHIADEIPVSTVNYNEIVEEESAISFSILKGKRKGLEGENHDEDEDSTAEKEEYISLYNYFECMKKIIFFKTKKENICTKILTFLYRPGVFLILLLLNYILMKNFEFGLIFFFVSILYQKEKTTEDIPKKLKLWMSFVAYVLVEDFAWTYGMRIFENLTLVQNIFTIIRTIYVILALGNDSTLNTIIGNIFYYMYQMKLILN